MLIVRIRGQVCVFGCNVFFQIIYFISRQWCFLLFASRYSVW